MADLYLYFTYCAISTASCKVIFLTKSSKINTTKKTQYTNIKFDL